MRQPTADTTRVLLKTTARPGRVGVPHMPRSQENHTLTGFTMGALPAVAADALVGIDTVDASATILTGVALAVINIWRRKKDKLRGRRTSRDAAKPPPCILVLSPLPPEEMHPTS